MSWSLSIRVNHPDGYESYFDVVDGHTYNLTPMWCKTGLIESTTRELHDMTCAALLPALKDALWDVVSKADEYRELDPPNGWGDYDGFFRIFVRFCETVSKHPTGTLVWSG